MNRAVCKLTALFLLVTALLPAVSTNFSISATAHPVTFSFSGSNLHYSPVLDDSATLIAVTALALPMLMIFEDDNQAWWKIPAYYSAAVGTSWVAKEMLKDSFSHPRPYYYRSYYQGTDERLYDSFPSGHTTMTATAAAFTATVYALSYPDSRFRAPVTASVTLLTLSSSGLRIFSGSHHPKDVFAGLVLGAAVGGLFGVLYHY